MRALAVITGALVACVPQIPSVEGKACDAQHSCGTGFVCLASGTCTANVDGGGADAGANGPIHRESQLGVAADAGTVISAALAPSTSTEKQLFLASIATKPPLAASDVSGLGLVWTRIKTQCAARRAAGVEVWQATAVGPTTGGAVTASFGASSVNAVLAVSRFDRVSAAPAGNSVEANAQGLGAACTFSYPAADDPSGWSIPLPCSANTIAYGAVALRNAGPTLDGSFSQQANGYAGQSGDIAGLSVQTRTVTTAGTVTVDGTFRNGDKTDWAGVAVEIR